MYRYERRYAGPVQAVILDLAGTCVDFGSLAPIQAFLALFQAEGLELTEAEAREPMGTEKREHIRRLLAMPRLRRQWKERKGTAPTEADIERLYHAFVPHQLACIRERTALIPGTLGLVAWCRAHHVQLAANTGYSRPMVEAMYAALVEQGFAPASLVCATEVPRGRPAPHMSLRNALELGVDAVQACVKVDDTVMGIEEGLNAGMWTVGFAVSGNETGLDLPAWQALSLAEQVRFRQRATQTLLAAGAHYVVDSIADLPMALDDIGRRLARGERP